jgi:hypothetical protein
MMTTEAPSMAKPALVAGLAFGVAGAIPIIEWINCACCALIIGCGLVAAYLHSKPMKAAGLGFTPGNGAVVGLAAGVVYGVVAGTLGALFDMMLGLTDMSQIIDQMEQVGTMDPEAMETVSRFLESTGPATIVLAGLFFSLLFGAIFGALGGLIGGALFKAEPAGSAMSDQAPPPPPPVTPSM